jgi:hypothetical protein
LVEPWMHGRAYRPAWHHGSVKPPTDLADYLRLPWSSLRIGVEIDNAKAQMMAATHLRLLDAWDPTATAVEQVRRLASAIADVYAGLDETDAVILADDWVDAFEALCDQSVLFDGWTVMYGESTGAWWPLDTSVRTRGVVNAVVRSEYVESLHAHLIATHSWTTNSERWLLAGRPR